MLNMPITICNTLSNIIVLLPVIQPDSSDLIGRTHMTVATEHVVAAVATALYETYKNGQEECRWRIGENIGLKNTMFLGLHRGINN